MTFLDMIVTQINHLNATHQVNVPLLLMTSFNTCSDTPRIIEKYAKRKTRIAVFNQSRYPLLMKETFQLYPKSASKCDEKAWYPPGHGDLYNSLMQSGVLDRLLRDGKEYLFVSESDNLGAVLVCRSRTPCKSHLINKISPEWIREFSSTWLTQRPIF